MPRTTINSTQTDARSPINQTLMDALRNNDSDHETRVLALEAYGNNWASQNGRALTDTHMGTMAGASLTDNTTGSALFNEIAKLFVFPSTPLYTSATEVTKTPAAGWSNIGSSFTFTAYRPFMCRALLKCMLDSDDVRDYAGYLRLKLTSSDFTEQYLYGIMHSKQDNIYYNLLNRVSSTIGQTGVWPQSDYTSYYNIIFALQGDSTSFYADQVALGAFLDCRTSGTTVTVQPQWICSYDTMQIKNRSYTFFAY